jgi:prolyl-tRNA synthetase
VNALGAGGRSDWTAADTLKNVVVKVRQPGATADQPLVIGVPGDREVDLKRLSAVLEPTRVALFEAADFAAHPDLVRGYIGPQGSADGHSLAKLGVRYLVDPRIVTGTAWVTGANEPGRHAIHIVCGRDFTPDGTIEAAEVRAGDACPTCGTGLTIRRGIEVGHVFQLGQRYAKALGLTALGPDGTPMTITMGSYGIGISRLVATIAEQFAGERGLLWPAACAPADVHLVATGTGPQTQTALELGAAMAAQGLRVLVDDRPSLSAGVKFTDAELIGIPRIVVVGRRLAEGYVELRDRATGSRFDVPVADIVGTTSLWQTKSVK